MTDALYNWNIYIAFQREFQVYAVESPPEPLRLFITCGADTGKSHLICLVHEHFDLPQIVDGYACMLMAQSE